MNQSISHILLVEDSPSDADFVRRMMLKGARASWQLTHVERLSEAIAACHATVDPSSESAADQLQFPIFQLVLLDLSLPDSDGLETITQFRAAVPNLPIVVLTTVDDDDLAMKTMHKGAQDYLVKGQITLQILSRTIRYAIERWQIMEQLQASLTQKEILIKELHHRVKNNLQIIVSLIKLQIHSITDEATLKLFGDCQNRIRAIALIHEMLYRSSNLTNIDAKTYIQTLVDNLFRAQITSLDSIYSKIEVPAFTLDIDTAIPCGLIINELVTNSLKYAFPARQGGQVKICFEPDGLEHLNLTVCDNGVGLPADLNVQQARTLGLQLVRNLVRQLNGTFQVEQDNGTCFKMHLKRHQA